jgi:hypothetical protein
MMKYAYVDTPPSEDGTTIHIPPVTVTEHADLYGPPGSKRIVARCGSCYGEEAVAGGVAWSTPVSRAEEERRARARAVEHAVRYWLQEREEAIAP